MENKRITLQVIADKTNVSKALVSRVLNDRPVRVSEQKRAQILQIAKEFEYIPSGHALNTRFSPKLNKTIALILPHLNYNFMTAIVDTVIDEAYKDGYSVIVFDSQGDSILESKYLDLCHSLNVTGIILNSFSGSNNRDYVDKLCEWGIPCVFIDCYPNDTRFSIISSKNKEGMYKLTESLIQRGHKNILSIIENKSALTNVSLERLNGYYAAMDHYKLSGYNEIIYPDRDYRQQPIYSLMSSSKEFTAFIIHTASDIQHFSNLISVTKYSENNDFEIGVFDDFDIPFTEHITGKYNFVYQKIRSIVCQNPKEIASQATNLLIRSTKKGASVSPVQCFVDCSLIDVPEHKQQLG